MSIVQNLGVTLYPKSLNWLIKSQGLSHKLLAAGFLPKYLQRDNTGETLRVSYTTCTKFNITIEMTAPYTPQQSSMVGHKFVMICNRSSAAMTSA